MKQDEKHFFYSFCVWSLLGVRKTGHQPVRLLQVQSPLKIQTQSCYPFINPQFDYADDFHEGRALVCVGKPCTWWDAPSDSEERWGYIDASGKMVITPQYGKAAEFSEGLASVCTGDCSASPTSPFNRGYIDRNGKIVIPMQFGIAANFSEGLAQVCIGTCRWKEKEGYNGKFGFIDHSGHFVINPQYDGAWDFTNGFAKVTVGKGDEAKTGYIDKTGKVIWQPSN